MEKKILVVDDEVAFTKMVKLNLERAGAYKVLVENQGKNAIKAAKEFQPDLIFLDIMMPDMTGDDVAQKLLEDEELRNVKFVFLTAIISRDETDAMGSNVGGREFLAKPVTSEDLLSTIERVLQD